MGTAISLVVLLSSVWDAADARACAIPIGSSSTSSPLPA
jgi:hypothetical protein